MTDFAARRDALTKAHGHPRHYPEAAVTRLLGGAAAGLNVSEVLAYAYPTREAAQAFHQLAHDEHGHASLGIVADPDGGGFVGVLDVRKQLAEARQRNGAREERTT